jgi:hypothetical protein
MHKLNVLQPGSPARVTANRVSCIVQCVESQREQVVR